MHNVSFTKMIDRTITVLSTRANKSHPLDAFNSGGVLRTTHIQFESQKLNDGEDLRCSSTTRLHDVGQLVTGDHASHISSKTSHELLMV